jgi:hypothetical protein
MARDTVARMDGRLSSAPRKPPPMRVLSTIFEEEATRSRPTIPIGVPVPAPAPTSAPKRSEAPEGEGYRVTKRARILKDKLGEFIRLHSKWFQESRWDVLVRNIRKRGDLEVQPGETDDPHPPWAY